MAAWLIISKRAARRPRPCGQGRKRRPPLLARDSPCAQALWFAEANGSNGTLPTEQWRFLAGTVARVPCPASAPRFCVTATFPLHLRPTSPLHPPCCAAERLLLPRIPPRRHPGATLVQNTARPPTPATAAAVARAPGDPSGHGGCGLLGAARRPGAGRPARLGLGVATYRQLSRAGSTRAACTGSTPAPTAAAAPRSGLRGQRSHRGARRSAGGQLHRNGVHRYTSEERGP